MKIKETILKYDTNKYNFQEIVGQLYVSKLNLIHNDSEDNYEEVKGLGRDSDTIFHKVFYKKYKEGWIEMEELYKQFIKEQIFPLIKKLTKDNEIVYQKFPTFRVHLPHNKVISTWHSDGDTQHQHPRGEINFILPLTRAYNTNTVWVESEPEKLDFHPVNMEYGEYLMFNGNQCIHGNKINKTGKTRVSFDFRVLPGSKYDDHYINKTVTTGQQYKIGSYYEIMEK